MAQARRRYQTKNTAAVAKNNVMEFVKMLLVVAIVTAGIIIWIRWDRSGDLATMSGDVFLDNITVNGIALAGKTYPEGEEAINQKIQERLNTPITLSFGENNWQLTPAMLDAKINASSDLALAWRFGHRGGKSAKEDSDRLKQEPFNQNTELVYDAPKLDEFVQTIKSQIDVRPVEAQIMIGLHEEFTVTPHQNGRALDADALKTELENAIVTGSTNAISLAPQIWPPEMDYDTALSITKWNSECTTKLDGSNDNRISNVKNALKKLNGLVVHPDEHFSFNTLVGKRTEENGFKEAQEYLDGELTTGIGGGVCQASTTLYRALREAGMSIDQRWQHSMVVGYTHPSLDSTVSDDGNRDLLFYNDTDYPMFIFTSVTNEEATVRVYTKKPPYKIVFTYKDLKTKIQAQGYKKRKDTKHKYVKSPDDPPVVVKGMEGKVGWESEGWLYYRDWETNVDVKQPERVSWDKYAPMQPTKWVYAN